MSESSNGTRDAGADTHARIVWDEEEIDAVPVLADEAVPLSLQTQASTVIERRPAGSMLPAAAAAAVAAGGFVAGAAVLGIVHRRSARTPALAKGGRPAGRSLGRRRREPAPQVLQVLSTRSLLVDVHVLGPPAGPAR